MPHAIMLKAPGGAENLSWDEFTMPIPAKGEVLLRQNAVGLNFIDIYHRTGFYPLPAYPAIIGMEAAGVVEELGDGVSTLKKGDLVAYGAGPVGAYAEYRIMPESKLVKLPADVKAETAAAIMLKGLTAQYLLRRTYHVKKDDAILVHAAAGGVGLLLCQWGKHLGARIIGTVGSEEKAQRAYEAGCDEVVFYRKEDVQSRVRAFTGGQGVQVVYDGIGKDTMTASLDSLAKLGMFVSYGQASGPMPPLDSQELSRRGSLFFTRPTLMDYVADPQQYQAAATEMFALVASGLLTPTIGSRVALRDAAEAHRALESAKTEGATILTI